MTAPLFDIIVGPLARRLQEKHMYRLGIANTMALAHAYNKLRFGRQDKRRRYLYRHSFLHYWKKMVLSSGANRDARRWAIDRSRSLPHLDRILADADEIIAELAGVRQSVEGTYRSYFQDMWTPADAERYPSFLDFATSTDVLRAVSHYLQCIPTLSTTLPSGVRFVESTRHLMTFPTPLTTASFFTSITTHFPMSIYCPLQITFEHGPWTFLPRTVAKCPGKTGVLVAGKPYRFTDAEIYSVVDRNEVIEFAYRADCSLSNRRVASISAAYLEKPRFQLMYAYTGVCRTDLSELIMKPKSLPDPRNRLALAEDGIKYNPARARSNPGNDVRRVPAPHFALPRPGVSRPARMSGDLR